MSLASAELEGHILKVRRGESYRFEYYWPKDVEEYKEREDSYYEDSWNNMNEYLVGEDDEMFWLRSNGMPADSIEHYYLRTTDLEDEEILNELLSEIESQLSSLV